MTTKSILIQVYSDLHIELWNRIPPIPVKAKYLFLVGDIGYINNPLFFPFLDYCSVNWIKTFYIPGNHEYYVKKKSHTELLYEYADKIKQRYKNVFYLNNSYVSLDEENINIYGSTFWTVPPFTSNYEAKMYINDYNNIKYFNQTKGYKVDIDTTYVKNLADESFTSLQKYLNETDKKTIVMTHFPPHRTGTSHPKYLLDRRIVNLYFAWPDETLQNFNLDNVLTWLSGHTHWSYDFIQNGIRLIGNQLGYKSEIGETGLNEDGVYEIIIS